MRRVFVAAAILLAFTFSSFAQTFSAPILDLEGKPVADGGSDLTLQRVSIQALLVQLPSEQNLAPEEKAKRFALALKIQSAVGTGKDPDLDVKELAAVREQIGRVFTPLVVGRAWELLDKKVK